MTDVTDGKLSDITSDANNANLGTQRGLGMLESSLRKHGAGRSILLDRQGRIIAGNKTVEQAGQIGLDDVIIVKTDGTKLVAVQREDLDLTDDSTGARELAYADNRVGELDLSWNPETILADLDSVDLSGLFREDELSEILGELGKAPQEDPGAQIDKAAELQEKWGTSLGQIWELGEHRLACGDCTDRAVVEAVMRGERADCVLTDPPYGIDKEKITGDEDLTVWINSIKTTYEVMRDKSFYCCFISVEKVFVISDFLRKFFSYKWQVIQYVNNGMVRGGVGFSVYILMLIFCKGNAKACNLIRDVRETSNSSQKMAERIHPYEKCELFVSDIINYSTNEDNLIFDPFLGSGTTLIACEQLGRKCRGIEIDPGYVGVTLERWHTMTGKDPVLFNA